MKDTTKVRIDAMAERIYRIVNFAPEDRDQPLTDIDQAGLAETREAIRLLVLEQDRDTRHACAEAVLSIYTGDTVMTRTEIVSAAHAACMNVKSI